MKSLKNISGLALLLLFAGSISACNILFAYEYFGWISPGHSCEIYDLSPGWFRQVLTLDGYEVDTFVMRWNGPPYPPPPRDWMPPTGYDVAIYWIMNPLEPAQQNDLISWVYAGGKLILHGEHWAFPTNTHLNDFLSNPLWSSALGHPQIMPVDISRWDFVMSISDGMYLPHPPFHCIDSLWISGGSAVYFMDSVSAESCGIALRHDTTVICDSIKAPYLGTYSIFGGGVVYLFADMFYTLDPGLYPEVLMCDNAQFVRDIFRCSPPLEDAWLGVERYRVILNLEGDTSGIVWDSIYVTFNEDSFYTVNLDWDYYPSGIDFNAVGDTGYAWVCVVRIPGPTGESLLPCGPICDSLWLEPAGITETLQPNGLAISIHPNPFNSSCRIYAPYGGAIEIFDVTGRKIIELPKNEYIWRPSECVSSGIYLIQVKNGMNSVSKRVLYIK